MNSSIPHEHRRIPMDQIIYIVIPIVPVFAVVKGMGVRHAVYTSNEKEFEQAVN